jgi:hypothetical protein
MVQIAIEGRFIGFFLTHLVEINVNRDAVGIGEM